MTNNKQEIDMENWLCCYNHNEYVYYIEDEFIESNDEQQIVLNSKDEEGNEIVYVINNIAIIDKYSEQQKEIGSKKVIIPRLKTTGTSENPLTITILNAEILDDSEVNDEIKLGIGDNALTLVAQNLWLEKNSSDDNNDYYTIINYCISDSDQISCNGIVMDQKYKYSITKENTYIKFLKCKDITRIMNA